MALTCLRATRTASLGWLSRLLSVSSHALIFKTTQHPDTHHTSQCRRFACAGTDATGFDKLYPGVVLHLMGLKPIFLIPFFREWIMMHGHATPGAKTIRALLGSQESVALAVGGAHESLDAFPGTYTLTIRKGFVRVAMQGGATLVPVVSFGENELYTQRENREGSKLRWLQLKIKQYFGFTVPLFCGRSWLPLLPKSVPLDTIVGSPVKVPHIAEPTDEQVVAARAKYVVALTALFEEHKAKYGCPLSLSLPLPLTLPLTLSLILAHTITKCFPATLTLTLRQSTATASSSCRWSWMLAQLPAASAIKRHISSDSMFTVIMRSSVKSLTVYTHVLLEALARGLTAVHACMRML